MKTSTLSKFLGLALTAMFVVVAPDLFAHAGHDKAPGEEGESATTGPIAITAEAKTNLGLKAEDAELRTLEKTFMVIGEIEAIPSRSAAVSSRISGRVINIKANEGELVKKVNRSSKWRAVRSAIRRRVLATKRQSMAS